MRFKYTFYLTSILAALHVALTPLTTLFKYKFDIPVLHVNGAYMAKHRITHADARAALAAAASGTFTPLKGEPDAARLEIVKPCKALR